MNNMNNQKVSFKADKSPSVEMKWKNVFFRLCRIIWWRINGISWQGSGWANLKFSWKWWLRRTFRRVKDVESSRRRESKRIKRKTNRTPALQHIKYWRRVYWGLLDLIIFQEIIIIKYHKRSVLQHWRVTAFFFSKRSVFSLQISSFSSSFMNECAIRFNFISLSIIEPSRFWLEGKVEFPFFSNTIKPESFISELDFNWLSSWHLLLSSVKRFCICSCPIVFAASNFSSRFFNLFEKDTSCSFIYLLVDSSSFLSNF